MLENNQRLLEAIRVGNIGIFDHDHAEDIIYWSLELRKMYGWDAEEPVTLPKILSHVHPEDRDRVGAAVARAHDVEGDGRFDIEHRIFDRRGELRWVLLRSQTYFDGPRGQRRPRRSIGAVQDVTERRKAEERLLVLDTVLRSSAQAIAMTDARGTLTFANAALARLWGYREQEALLGRSIFELWKIADEPATVLEQIRTNHFRAVELPATRADGSHFYLGVTAEAVCGANGELTQILLTFADVTNRKELEAQLIHAQKMESIGRLAGGVAHDFNNLLTVISGGIGLGLRALAPGHPSHDSLIGAAEAARSAEALTRQLLAFSRKETIAPKALDLNEIVRRMRNVIVRLIGDDIQLETTYGQDVAPIWFDPVQVEQTILNLAVNARDAMARGGRLAIETSNVSITEKHDDARPETYALLTVSDSGVGMTDDVRAHLFEPFFTTKDTGKGTGLGLAMVYGAVQQNGGRIEVETELGRGSVFKIYLPVAAIGLPAQAPQAPAPLSRARSLSILLVEDHDQVAAFAKKVLEQLGHTVHVFPNGEQALASLLSLRPSPNLLITDVIMPGMDGRTLAERVATTFPGIRVLFVSGYTHNLIAERGTLVNGIEFLAKPFSAEQLALRVQQVVEKYS